MHSRLISALFAALLIPASAQEAKEEKKPEKGLQVQLLAEAAPKELGKVYLAFGETKSEGVDLPTNELSPPIPVPAREMILKTQTKDISLCSILLPEAGKKFAIVFVTAKPAGYKPIVVRTDDPTFKVGDVMFINRTDKTMLGKLGDTPLVLNAGEFKKARPSNPKENAFYDIAFAVREPSGDRLISSTRWPIDQTIRSYVFFFTNAEGRTSYRAVDEFVIPENPGKP